MRVLIHDFIAFKQEGFDNVIVYGWLSKLVAAAVDNINIWLLRNWVNLIYSSKVSRTFRPMANNPPGWKSHEVKWQYRVDMLPSIKTHARFHVMIDSWTVYDMSHNDVAWPSWPLKSTTTRLFAAQFVWANITENFKVTYCSSFFRESTDDRWSLLSIGQQRGKLFHVMTPSWAAKCTHGFVLLCLGLITI